MYQQWYAVPEQIVLCASNCPNEDSEEDEDITEFDIDEFFGTEQ